MCLDLRNVHSQLDFLRAKGYNFGGAGGVRGRRRGGDCQLAPSYYWAGPYPPPNGTLGQGTERDSLRSFKSLQPYNMCVFCCVCMETRSTF